MKKIENKQCEHLSLGQEKGVKYNELIDYCVRKVPAESLNGDLILRIVNIHNALEKMEFEDADYQILKQFVKRATWGTPGAVMDIEALKEINQFVTDVCSME